MTELLGKSEVPELCLTLCDPTDCGLPGSSVHGIFPAIVLEWIAISFSRGSSQPRDWTQKDDGYDKMMFAQKEGEDKKGKIINSCFIFKLNLSFLWQMDPDRG